jgi:hypothetical protein
VNKYQGNVPAATPAFTTLGVELNVAEAMGAPRLPATAESESFSWDNQRYESVFEQHTGITVGLLDHGICLGLTLFGLGSVAMSVVMAIFHMIPH